MAFANAEEGFVDLWQISKEQVCYGQSVWNVRP